MTLSPVQVCTAIANTMLETPASMQHAHSSTSNVFGEITLHTHQREALQHVEHALTNFGGALLSDDVGLGKTYVALAAAARYANIHIIAPAALRSMWHDALGRTHITAAFTSIESLSARAPRLEYPKIDVVIVDEAHHVRTPTTKRYTTLARLCATAKVLLLSATPIHNKQADLTALLALIVGDRAPSLSDNELGELIIRRTKKSLTLAKKVPTVYPTQWIHSDVMNGYVQAILALPPTFPVDTTRPATPKNAKTPPYCATTTLLAHTLLHQLASSEAALRASLVRRRNRGYALLSALDAGRYPSKRELTLWTIGEDVIQLAFPNLVPEKPNIETSELATAVRTHTNAVGRLIDRLVPHSLTDHTRAKILRDIKTRHPHERIVAFSQYAATIHALFRALRTDGRIAALTAPGGMVASGPISRNDTIARFTAPHHHPATAIDLLLTTDLLSEGVNLQTASVIVHLDLPWTAAKLEQRVGRIARLGSKHDAVSVYGILPPANVEKILHATRIVQTKTRLTRATLGKHSLPEITESIRARLRAWQSRVPPPLVNTVPPHVASTIGKRRTFLAACRIGDRPILLTTTRKDEISASPSDVLETVEDANCAVVQSPESMPAVKPDTLRDRTAEIQASIANWFTYRHAAADAGVSRATLQNSLSARKRTFAKQLAALTHAAPLTQRAQIAPHLARTYRALATPLAPATLDLPSTGPITVDTLLPVASAAERIARPTPDDPHTAPRLIALLLLDPSD